MKKATDDIDDLGWVGLVICFLLLPIAYPTIWIYRLANWMRNSVNNIGADYMVRAQGGAIICDTMNAFRSEYIGKEKIHHLKRWRLNNAKRYAEKINGTVESIK